MKSSCKLLIYSLVVMISGRKLLIYGYSCYAKSVSFYKTTFTVTVMSVTLVLLSVSCLTATQTLHAEQ